MTCSLEAKEAINRRMGPPTITAAFSTLFFSQDQVVRIELPAEARFIMFFRNHTPEVVPINDPGVYHVDCTILKSPMEWPVMISVIPLDKVKIFLSMTPDHVGRIIDRAEAKAFPDRDTRKA